MKSNRSSAGGPCSPNASENPFMAAWGRAWCGCSGRVGRVGGVGDVLYLALGTAR